MQPRGASANEAEVCPIVLRETEKQSNIGNPEIFLLVSLKISRQQSFVFVKNEVQSANPQDDAIGVLECGNDRDHNEFAGAIQRRCDTETRGYKIRKHQRKIRKHQYDQWRFARQCY
jgi:hypothetical protein